MSAEATTETEATEQVVEVGQEPDVANREASTETTDNGQEPFDEAKARDKIAKANREAQNLRERLRKLEETMKGKVDESEVEKAAREAAAKTVTEWETRLALKEKEAELYRVAAGRLRNPADALAFINLAETDDVAAAVDTLLTERDYLAAPQSVPAGRDAASKGGGPKPKQYSDMTVEEYAEARGMKLPGRRR